MKYISRWAALLLAVMMTITSAGAELSLEGLTQEQLETLYQTAAKTEIAVTDVLGATNALWSEDIQEWADSGYTLQWYSMDDAGVLTVLNGQNTASLSITYTLMPQRFVCIATDSNGKEYISATLVAQAQTSDMEGYLNHLCEPEFWNEDDTPNARAIYDHMNTVWNVDIDGTNLAQNVIAAWWAERAETWFDYQLLCSCVITGAAEADFCMLHPYAAHVGTCGWYAEVDVVEDETTGITVSGDLPVGVSLQVTAATGKMPEIDTSHVDITATSPMVRSYNITLLDENGDKYILPEGTTVQVTIPNVWSDWMSNPIVDVYHVTDDGEVIYLTSTKGEVVLLDDHSICFETDGFSDFAVLVGIRKHDAVANGGVLDIPMAPGTVVKIGEYWQSYVGCESTASGVVDVIYSNKYYCISVAEDAPIGTTATVTIQFSEWDGTKTATVNVTVVDEEWPTTIDNVVSVGATTTSTHFPDFSIARYQMAPDTTAIVACGSSNFIAESSNANAVIAAVQGNSIYINATSGATSGDTAKVYIRDEDSRILKSIVLIDIIDEQKPTQVNQTITAGSHNAGTVGNQNSEMVRYFKMAPDTSAIVTCPTTNIDDSSISLRATDGNVAFTRNEGTFYITTATNAVAGSTAKLVVRDKTTQAVVMVVFIDIIDESEDIAYTNTYVVDRGDAETYTYDDNSSNVYKYNLAPGLTASARGYGDVEFTVADTSVATVALVDGVLQVTADANAEIDKTTKIVVKDKTTKAVVTTIFVEIVEKQVTISEEYTVNSSISNKNTYTYAGESDNDKAYKYYLAPGLLAIAGGYNDVEITVADATVATATLEDGVLTVAAQPDAAVGQTTKVTVKDKTTKAVLTTIFVEIVERQIIVTEYTIDRNSSNRETYTYDSGNDNVYRYKIAPGMQAIARGYEEAECMSENTAVALAGLSEDGVLTVTAAPGATVGQTTTITVTEKGTEAVLTTIYVEIVEPQYSIIETYTIDREDLNKETYAYAGASETGYAYKYNLAAGLQAIAKGYGSNVKITVDDQGVVGATLSENGELVVTATENAQPGQTAKVTVTDADTDAVLTTILVEIVVSPKVKLNSTDYPLQISIRDDGSLPNEPCEWDKGSYTYITSSYGTGIGGGIYFAGTAADVIDSTIFAHELFYFVSRDGTETIGMVDPTGVQIKNVLKANSVNWAQILTAAAEKGTLKANDGNTVDSSNVSDYEIVPYVVKCQEGTLITGKGWHIDCALVLKDTVTLSYDMNIPAGMTVPKTVYAPMHQTGKAPATFTVGTITGMTNDTVMVQHGDAQYTFTFLGWNDKPDGTGETYSANGEITISEDTILYAMWSSNPEIGTGNLLIRKTVSSDPIDETQVFTFDIGIRDTAGNASNAEYAYTIYGTDNVTITNGRGRISNGGSFELRHGQYIVIENLPISAKDEGSGLYTPNITVAEAAVSGYAPSWEGGTATGATVNIIIRDGRRTVVECINAAVTTSVTTLTVKKTGMRDGESAIIEVRVDGKTYLLSLSNTHDSDTIVNLPVNAAYTVTELNAWTWQYAENSQPVTGNTVAGGSTVTISNTQKNGSWMHDESSVINNLGTDDAEKRQTPINNQ